MLLQNKAYRNIVTIDTSQYHIVVEACAKLCIQRTVLNFQ